MHTPRILAATQPDSPLRVALYYALFGACWIVGTDTWVAWQMGKIDERWTMGMLKGLLFIVVTAGLLFLLTRRLVRRHVAMETALQENEERLALALEATNQGLFDWNIPSGVVVVNDAYATMLRYEPAHFRESAAAWFERLHPGDLAPTKQSIDDYLAGRIDHYRAEFRLRTATGDWCWIHSRGRIVERDPAGRPLRMVGVHTDIGERKSAEARLMDALGFAKTILNNSPIGVLVYGSDGRAVTANEAAAQLAGTDVPGLLRQNFREMESWRRYGLLAAAEEALATGKQVVHRGPFQSSFGRSGWIEVRFKPFYYQNATHLLLLVTDESEKRQALAHLHLLDAAVQAAPIGWVVTDADGVIKSVNPGFTALTGYTAEEVTGHTPRVLKSGRHTPEFYAAMWAAIKRGEVWSGEMFNQRKDGVQYHERMTIAPVRDESGAVAHYVAIKQDITGQKQLEQQLARAQRLESIGMLASGIAHDLNNIFAPILLSLELLKVKYPTADARKTLEMIETAGQRGAGIVRQVLTFARGIDGERTIVPPRYLVKEAADILGETLPRNIRVETDLAARLPAILGDPTQLHQVLLNLAINARDAMPNGGRLVLGAQVVQVDAARAARNPPLRPGSAVALSVSDTGTGIPPQVLERMFEPFFTTKPLGRGTGLGLSTVYGIVRSHGGAVEIATKLGEGTVFTVLLPALDPSTERPDERPVSAAPFAGDGRRVLVVDDEEAIRLITLSALRQHNFAVEVAADGIEALEIFRTDPSRFAAVITDLMMPRMNGRNLARELRRLAPGLPIIASSGLSEEGAGSSTDDPSLAAAGVRILLRKPYTETELLAALRQELEPAASS